MAKDYITEQLKKEFAGQHTFSRQDLFDFYRRFDSSLKDTTFRWRIYDLKKKKIISPISRDLFSFTHKPVFRPEVTDPERKLITKLLKEFPGLKACIWSTQILSEFMLHQPGRSITIIEVEKDALETVFHFLKDSNMRDLYLIPEQKELDFYVYEGSAATIVEALVSKAPIQKLKKIPVPTLEKIVVDIFTDRMLFATYQGSELGNIIDKAYQKYQLDFTRLFSYAKRRRKETDLMEFLSNHTSIPQTILND